MTRNNILDKLVQSYQNEDVAQIREVVEGAVDNGDMIPLIRLVFEEKSELDSPSSNTSTHVPMAESIKVALEHLVHEEDAAAAQICRANTTLIANALDELDSMQIYVQQISLKINASDSDIQAAGEPLLHQLKEYSELREIEKQVLDAGQNLEWACEILHQCAAVCQYIDQHKLYQALRTLEDIQSNMHESFTCLNSLESFRQEIIEELISIVQQIAVADFNDWLVSARSEARQIGLQAIRNAAIYRQHEDKCANERKEVLDHIRSGNDLQEAVALTIPGLGSHDTASETASRPTFQSLDVMSITETIAVSHIEDDHWDATSVLSEAGRSSIAGSVSVLQSRGTSVLVDHSQKTGMNMRGLHRCIHVHKCMGKINQFREYYLQQRHLQMDSDLRPPTNFLEVYQTYLAQVTGFFIIEDNVLRMTDGLITQQDMDAFWEMAISMLKSVVDTAFEGMNSYTAMLLVKDFLLLVCSGLSKYGYPAANLKDILSSNMGKYHNLMNWHVSKQVTKIFEEDDMEHIKIISESMQQNMIESLNLPYSFNPKLKPSIPYTAPFTTMVPGILWLVQEYVRDSVAYCKGLINPGDLLPSACLHKDKMLKIVVEAVQGKLKKIEKNVNLLKESMQLVTNMWALSQGLQGLDDWIVLHILKTNSESSGVNNISKKPSNCIALTLKTGSNQACIRSLEESAQRVIVMQVTSKVDEFLSQVRQWDFTPKQPPAAATSPVIEDLMIYLQMPPQSINMVLVLVFQTIASHFLDILTGSSISGINEYGFQKLLGDLTALELFSDKCSISNLGRELCQPRELCAFIVSGKLEIGNDIMKMHRTFPKIDIPVLITVLERFRDLGGWQGQRGSKRITKKKDVDVIIKYLKDLKK